MCWYWYICTNRFNLTKLLKTNKEKRNDDNPKTRPLEFIIMRISIWNNKDKNCLTNRKTLKEHNDSCEHKIITWIYHYYSPNVDWETQRDTLSQQLEQIKLVKWKNLPIAIDIESKPEKKQTETKLQYKKRIKERKEWFQSIIKELEDKYETKPIIYSWQSFYDDNLKDIFDDDYPLWIAHYNGDESSKLGNIEIHQLTNRWNVYWANDSYGHCDIDNMWRTTLTKLTDSLK